MTRRQDFVYVIGTYVRDLQVELVLLPCNNPVYQSKMSELAKAQEMIHATDREQFDYCVSKDLFKGIKFVCRPGDRR